MDNRILAAKEIMIRHDSLHSTNRTNFRDTIRNKMDASSLLSHSAHKFRIGRGANLLGKFPLIEARKKAVPVYLLYRNTKIVVEAHRGMPYAKLVPELYRHILEHELKSTHKSRQEVQKIIKGVLGFSTVELDLKTDYLLSILEGSVEKSLLLNCFYKCKSTTNYGSRCARLEELKQVYTGKSVKLRNQGLPKFEYEIYSCLAIGGFSKVYLARSYEDGKFYVIKFIKKKNQQDELYRESVKNEMQICSQLNHPFIIKMREGFQAEHFYCMVFEYCPGGELFYLLKRVNTMSEDDARVYFLQILLAIRHIHEKKIIYRDLKPENILIDCKGHLKIVDFGLSKKVQSTREKTFSYCGSAQYMAPEMILRSGHNMGVDYYSLGALLYELVTGLPPFYTKNSQQLQESIITRQLSFPSHISLSEDIQDLLRRLLTKDCRQRLGSYAGIKQMLFHPWIGKFNSEEILSKSGLRVPFPPNLHDHNFDPNELGDDQQQFTQEVRQNFSNNRRLQEIKYYVKPTADQKDLNYYSIIVQVLKNHQHTEKVAEESGAESKGELNTVKQAIKVRKNRVLLQSIQNPIVDTQKQNQAKTPSREHNISGSAQFKRTTNLFTVLKSHRKFEIDQSTSKQKSGEKSLEFYRNNLPYCQKNKICRPMPKSPSPKGLLRKANILKLRFFQNHDSHAQESQ